MWVFWQYTQTESDRLRQYTGRLKGKSFRKKLRNIWQMGFSEVRNVGGPNRSDKGCHDPSNKTRPDKREVSSREKNMADGLQTRVQMSADRVDWTWAVTTCLTKRDLRNLKSVRERLRKIWQIGFREGRNVSRLSRSNTGHHGPSKKCDPTKGEVSSRETLVAGGFQRG